MISSRNSPDLPKGTVTFLFTDIEGSTMLLKQLGAERYGDLLTDQRHILRSAFAQFNGSEIDTQGDSFFVSFPRATLAIAAVVEIQRALADHDWPNGVEVRLRMGLHTGEPLVAGEGYVGMDVHRAARIAHAGHGGQVLLSETTTPLVIDELPEGVDLLDLGRHKLKDMRRPEWIHQLVIEGLPSQFPPLKSLEMLPPAISLDVGEIKPPDYLQVEVEGTPPPLFVGRERELDRLAGYLDQAGVGQGGVVFITGGPGRGKTALMLAFARQAMKEHPDLLVAAGKCNAYTGAGDPYAPFREVLGDLTGDVEAKWAAGAISQDHAKRLWEAMPFTAQAIVDHGPDLVEVFIPGNGLLARSSSAVPEGRGLLQSLRALVERERAIPGEMEQKALFEQFLEVLRQVASKRPLLILLDDLQWADSASLNLLFHLGREIPGGRILVVGAYRPEEVALGRGGERHPLEEILAEFKRLYGDAWIDLSAESADEGRTFIDSFLDSEPNWFSPDFRQALYTQTGGHPLFTVELLREMQARGDLVQDEDGYWIEGEALNWDRLPARVEGVIEARIGRLQEELREILTIASVEGEDFTAQVIARVQEIQERGLLRRLNRDLNRQHRLIEERGQQTVERQRLYLYRFRHSLFQQHLYNGLAASERELLHAEVGAVLEELYGKDVEQIAPQLAWHFGEAGEVDKAIHYLLQAGDHARKLFANQEAASFYERALKYQKESSQVEAAARTLMLLGLTHQTVYDFRRARQAYDESFTLRQQAFAILPENLPPAPHPLRQIWGEPVILDPGIYSDHTSAYYLLQLFSGLLRLDADWTIQPEIARDWDISDDGLRYVFHLRDDVNWSDGHPVTALDFQYAWKRILNPNTPSGLPEMLYAIHGAKAYYQGESANPDSVAVEAVEPYILEVKLAEPAPYFLYLLTNPNMAPVPRHVIERHGSDWTKPENLVTNGPFSLQDWKPREKISLERNPNYFGRFRGNLTQVEFVINLPVDGLTAYRTGEVDIYRLEPENIHARHLYTEEYNQLKTIEVRFLGFGLAESPFHDKRLRQAFAMSIDKEHIANEQLHGWNLPAKGGFVPPGIPGHSSDIGLPFNPERAKQLLSEAGHPDGRGFPQVDLLYSSIPREKKVARTLQGFWDQYLGVRVNLKEMAWKDFLKHNLQSPLYITGWRSDYPDPDNFLRVAVRKHTGLWQHEEYGQLIEKTLHSTNQNHRMKLYRQADRILVEEAAIVPTAYYVDHFLVKPWLKIPKIDSFEHLYMKDIIIEPHA